MRFFIKINLWYRKIFSYISAILLTLNFQSHTFKIDFFYLQIFLSDPESGVSVTNIAERLKTLRLTLQLNQKEMAETIGFSQSYLCGIENGLKTPNTDFLIALSAKFGISVTWLLNGFGPMFSGSGEKDMKYFIRERSPLYISSEALGKIAGGIENGKMFFFEVESDNMEPAFLKGDKAVIDSSDKELQDCGVYLFDINSRKTIKRCFKTGNWGFKLTNDKPVTKNNDIFFDSSMECLGRVVWIIREIK